MSARVALSVAGSDPSGGAGIQADLKTFAALGAYGCCVLTALTAQNTRGVTGVHPVPPEFVAQQLRTLFDDVRVHATKIGMLADAGVVHAVADVLESRPGGPVVLDPVMVSTSGHRLIADDAVTALRERLLPLADVITPNVPEAAALLGAGEAGGVQESIEQAEELSRRYATRVLLKGGHLSGEQSVDVLTDLPDRGGTRLVVRPRVDTPHTHGTGCTLSSAIAALLAHDTPEGGWAPLVERARDYLQAGLLAGRDLDVGGGHGPLDHFPPGSRPARGRGTPPR